MVVDHSRSPLICSSFCLLITQAHFSSVLSCNKVLSSVLYLLVDHSKSPPICSSVYLSISQGPLSSIPLSTCGSVKDPSHLFFCLLIDQLKTPLICSSFCLSISQTDIRVLCTKSFLHGRSPRPPKAFSPRQFPPATSDA